MRKICRKRLRSIVRRRAKSSMSESNFKSMESSEEYNGTLSESSTFWLFLYASCRSTVFAETSEAELATLILDFTCRGFPLSEVQVRNVCKWSSCIFTEEKQPYRLQLIQGFFEKTSRVMC